MSSEGHAHDCKRRDIDFTISSGNFFAGLGFAEPDTELVKAELVHPITAVIEQRDMTQVEAVDLMVIKQPNVSLLLRGRTENYSVGRLITLLSRLGHDVIIAHREKPGSQRIGRTRVRVLKAAVGAVAEEGTTCYRAGAKRSNVRKAPGLAAKGKTRG
mgnify:CR=1 FL=1